MKTTSLKTLSIQITADKISDYCRRWRITELALFGSILRDDFKLTSDVDVLVSFQADAQWTLLDHVEMQDELATLFGREVDLVSRRGLEHSGNTIRRDAILTSAQVIYATA